MSKLLENISDKKRIAIFTHILPDADAICSALTIQKLINENFYQKRVDIFIDGEIGEKYNLVLQNETINPTPCEDYDMAIVLDCPNLERTGKNKEMIEKIGNIVNIDHHETNTKFGKHNVVSNEASSTCELMFLIAQAFDWKLNDTTAKLIYQGILTDTNCFTSSSMTKRSHIIISKLLKYDFDDIAIKDYYMKSNSKAKILISSAALKSMEFYKDGKLTVMKIPYKIYSKAGASFDDTLGIVEMGINVLGAELSAIYIEKEPNKFYVSLRSKEKIDASEIAKEFNGGGHKHMAAFQFEGNHKEIEKKFLEKVSPILDKIEKTETIDTIKF